MRSTPVILSCVLCLACMAIADPITIGLDVDTPPDRHTYVDLNGDGIDDNFIDSDRDGIPDRYVHGTVSALGVDVAGTSGIFGGAHAPEFSLSISYGNRDLFGSRLGRTRCLSQNRGGFGAEGDFGPGNGIGLGAVKGTGCVGGICF